MDFEIENINNLFIQKKKKYSKIYLENLKFLNYLIQQQLIKVNDLYKGYNYLNVNL